MSNWVIRTLRTVIVIALLGSALIQVVIVASPLWDGDKKRTGTEVALAVIVVLGIVALQVIAVAVWRLLTMVGARTVFSFAAFRYVDLVIAAISVGAVLVFAVAVVARFANHATPGDEVAPGVIAMICGIALVVGGAAMVVYVMRTLLAQAVALDSEAKSLKSELDEVI